jgi:hypothetical protein
VIFYKKDYGRRHTFQCIEKNTMILDDPEMFLHHVDFSRRVAVFVRVNRERINGQNAHNFDNLEPKYTAALNPLLEHHSFGAFRPPCFLFMADFCGSTLLANGLHALKSVRCLYEIRAFAGLAMQKRVLDRKATAGSRPGDAIADWRRVLLMVIGAVTRTCGPVDTLIIKEWPPTNYIISEILQSDDRIRALFLYSDFAEYLNAVFRRNWRRDFTRRRTVTELLETDAWPAIDENKRFFSDGQIAATHYMVQQQAFLGIPDSVLPRIRSVFSSDWYDRPAETLTAAAIHFGIAIDSNEAAVALASVSARHSKDREKPYGMTERLREIQQTAQDHRLEIADALMQANKWMEAYHIPTRLPCDLYTCV